MRPLITTFRELKILTKILSINALVNYSNIKRNVFRKRVHQILNRMNQFKNYRSNKWKKSIYKSPHQKTS